MKKTTISDVASRAGVSKATVSAVLNNKGTVADSTRRTVLQAIKELNYRPSAAARQQFKTPARRMIGFIIKEADNPYYAEVLSGVEDVAHEHGYQTYVSSSAGDYEIEHLIAEQLYDLGFAGVIITPILNDDVDIAHIFELKRGNVPFVLLEKVRGLQSNLVDVDNELASYEAVKHLIDLGHSEIVHFAGPSYSAHSEERVAGVRRAFSESHLKFDASRVIHVGDSLADGYRAGMDYFSAKDGTPTSAITCYNDLVALGLLKALRELDIPVPDSVSVIGFDNLRILDYVTPALTTVDVPRYDMGSKAAEILIRQIESQHSPAEKIALQANLMLRDSTAPPPTARRSRSKKATADVAQS